MLMIRLWKKLSDVYKVLMTMFFLIIVIQLGNLVYIWKFESILLLKKEKINLEYQLENNAKSLLNQMNILDKELKFLASLNVMDDVIINDIDKRVKILLTKKAKDLSQGIVLLAKLNETVVATSGAYNKKDFLLFSTPLFSSFNTKDIGELVLLYPLKNFKSLKSDNLYKSLWLESSKIQKIHFEEKNDDYIVVTKDLWGILDGWKLFLSYKKEFALQSIKQIEKVLFFSFLFSIFLLLFISWKLFQKQIAVVQYTQEILSLKRIFLSTMSHELRTPLGSILNLTQHLMVNPKMNDNSIDMLKHIENASEHLLAMINNLLQLSKLESNTIVVKKEIVDVIQIIEEVVDIVKPLIDDKELCFSQTIAIEHKKFVTDSQFFKQVLMNLLSNAIKFTHSGSIQFILKENNNVYTLSIIDTGIGISKSKQASLFSEFYQAHDSRDIKYSVGLGLALSQKVSKLIGGEITIQSEGEQKGTVATFIFSSL